MGLPSSSFPVHAASVGRSRRLELHQPDETVDLRDILDHLITAYIAVNQVGIGVGENGGWIDRTEVRPAIAREGDVIRAVAAADRRIGGISAQRTRIVHS